MYCREKKRKWKWKEREKKRDRIHSFQILVCGKTESQLLISNSSPTSMDRHRCIWFENHSLIQYEPNAMTVYRDFSVLTGNEKATWRIIITANQNIFDVQYIVIMSGILDQWEFTMGGTMYSGSLDIEAKPNWQKKKKLLWFTKGCYLLWLWLVKTKTSQRSQIFKHLRVLELQFHL